MRDSAIPLRPLTFGTRAYGANYGAREVLLDVLLDTVLNRERHSALDMVPRVELDNSAEIRQN